MAAYSVRAAGVAIVFLLLGVPFGCQRGQPPTQPGGVGGGGQAASAQEQALQELLKYAQETGQTLEQVRQDLERLAATQRERGTSAVQTDLHVLSVLLNQAREAVAAKDSAKSQALLARMGRVGRGLLAELPGQKAALCIERAVAFLSAEVPDTAAARAALASAADALAQAKDTGLVPNVGKSLESARGLIDTKPEEARRWLEAALDECAKDKVATWAYNITLDLTSAFQAVQREAWLVAAAELDQVQTLITRLQSAASATPAPAVPAQGQQPGVAPAGGGGQAQTPPAGETLGSGGASGSPAPSAAPAAGQQLPPSGDATAPSAPAQPAAQGGASRP